MGTAQELELETLHAERVRRNALNVRLRQQDREAMREWLTTTWPAGLPELLAVHEAIGRAGLSVDRARSEWGRIKAARRLVKARSMRWLAKEIAALGLTCAPSTKDGPAMPVLYRSKLEIWRGILKPASNDTPLAELRHHCNRYLRSIRFGPISSKKLGAYLRAHGWQTARRNDGQYVLRCNM